MAWVLPGPGSGYIVILRRDLMQGELEISDRGQLNTYIDQWLVRADVRPKLQEMLNAAGMAVFFGGTPSPQQMQQAGMHLKQALRPGGPLVILREKQSASASSAEETAQQQREKEEKARQKPPASKKTWIDFQLLDPNGRPIKGAKYSIKLTDGSTRQGTLDDNGEARFSNIDEGTCVIEFPDIDGREWTVAGMGPSGASIPWPLGAPTIKAGAHTVKQGEHVSRIAAEAGFLLFKTIWDDSRNAALRQKRKNPNVLYPGDVVQIPEKQKKTEQAATTKHHTYQIVAEPLLLRVVFKEWTYDPIAGKEVVLDLSGQRKLTTNSSGQIETEIPKSAEAGKLSLLGVQLPVKVGHLDPVEEVSGQVGRLNNLGYFAGPVDKPDPEALKSALEEFQCDQKIKVSGQCDAATQAKLKDVHGC